MNEPSDLINEGVELAYFPKISFKVPKSFLLSLSRSDLSYFVMSLF